jgi:hypothetical protein
MEQARNFGLYWEGLMAWKANNVIAVRIGVGPSIMLQSGAWFDFAAPHSSPFTIEDIAHGAREHLTLIPLAE